MYLFSSNLPGSSLRPPSLGLHPSMAGPPPPPHGPLDPLLHYSSMAGLYGVRERMELEREREIRERDLNDRIKEEMLKQQQRESPYAVGLSPHLLGGTRGFPPPGIPHTSIASGGLAPPPPPSMYTPAAAAHAASTAQLIAAERERYERFGKFNLYLFIISLSSRVLAIK